MIDFQKNRWIVFERLVIGFLKPDDEFSMYSVWLLNIANFATIVFWYCFHSCKNRKKRQISLSLLYVVRFKPKFKTAFSLILILQLLEEQTLLILQEQILPLLQQQLLQLQQQHQRDPNCVWQWH